MLFETMKDLYSRWSSGERTYKLAMELRKIDRSEAHRYEDVLVIWEELGADDRHEFYDWAKYVYTCRRNRRIHEQHCDSPSVMVKKAG